MSDMLLTNPERFLSAMLFAMLRVGGAFVTAPIFSHLAIPVQLRILLAAAIAVAVVTTHPPPPIDLLSARGLIAGAAEVTIGLVLGFVLALAFAAPMVAGEQISAGAGLGFAAFSDPQSGITSPAIGQFLHILLTLLFLAFDGHLRFLEIVVRSYAALPPGDALPSAAHLRDIAQFGAFVFEAGLLIALPIAVALMCVNLSLGVLTRAAPQLNIFAIGLPVSVFAAMAMLALAFPALVELMTAIVGRALDVALRVALG